MYFDHASTSPTTLSLNRKISELLPLAGYNPSSSHSKGLELREALEDVRSQVARFIGAKPWEVFFTSGATESNNLALQGGKFHKKGHLISSAVEHDSVEETLFYLESQGFSITRLAPDQLRNKSTILRHLREDTQLVSIMAVQNETGECYPLEGLGEELRKRSILYHRDGVQALGKIPFNVHEEKCDMASFSAHKLGGLKGLGILYLREGLKLQPLIYGGSQESTLRPGTENTLAILALGEVLKELKMGVSSNEVAELSTLLKKGIIELGGKILSPGDSTPYIVAVSFPLPSEVLLSALSLKGVYVSAGSACHAKSGREARIIPYLEDKKLGKGFLRFSLSRHTTREEIEHMLDILSFTLKELKRYL